MLKRALDMHDLMLAQLALLDEQPRSAGALLAQLQTRLGDEWRVSGARAFVALDALEAEALAEVDSSEQRTTYRLTDAGTAALTERAAAPILTTLARPGRQGLAAAAGAIGELGEVAVLFTDVVGSTELFDREGAAQAHEILRRHFALLHTSADEHGGRVVKNLGDGLMVVFDAAGPAAECALAMQRAVDGSPDPLELRVGIASGEAVCDEGDYFGRPVIVAKRLCDVARPGDIVLADATHRLIPALPGQSLEPVGELQLKGLSEPVAASALRTGPQAA